MPNRWSLFADPAHHELLAKLQSADAGTLQFEQLHHVAQEALTKF